MIRGVIVKKLDQFDDYRGNLKEIYRADEDPINPAMSYVSHTNYGITRGPHEHVAQSDFFIFCGYGDFTLHLWDNRKNSETYGKYWQLVVGESNKVSVIVPPGVVHGYKSISKQGSFSINLPDKLYRGEGKKEEIDEIRHESDENSPFKIPLDEANSDKKKIFVTGGSGFIGSNFIKHMLEKYPHYEITNYDALTYAGNNENLVEVENNPHYKFFKGDITNQEFVEHVMKGNEWVVNFAAETHVDNSINESFVFTKTNVLGTHTLLETARKLGIKKFLHISTDEVYGSIKEGSFHEESSFKPNSPYSSSKAAADLLARSYWITHQLPVVITRSSNNYGPHQHPEKFIPLFITNLLEGKKVPLYGDGANVRDWIHVLDNCKALDFVLHHGEPGQAYNIGGESELSNLEMTKILLAQTGRDENHISYVEDRKGHDFRYSLNCEKLKQLGWKQEIGFSQGLKSTIDWYKNNEKWWRQLK